VSPKRWPPKSRLTPRERQIREVMERKDRAVEDFDLPRFRRRLRWALIATMALQPPIVVLEVVYGVYAFTANIVAIPICAYALLMLKVAEIREGPLQPADGQDGPAGPEPQTPVQGSAAPTPTPSSNSAPRARFVAPPLLDEEEPLEGPLRVDFKGRVDDPQPRWLPPLDDDTDPFADDE
jgi:hypothetical protein